ncbi:MAG: type IV toxin-antitoxin system AbiEi family antitoxin [Chloroflexota bacterium]
MNTRNIKSANGLGKKASGLLTTLAGEGKTIFTTQEAHDILAGSISATYKMLHDLRQGNWLLSLGKGRYLIIPLEAGPERQYTTHGFLIAHHLAPDGYIAYWTALHHHGLTEQIPRPVWVATTRRRKEVIIAGVRYIFVALRPHKVFGHERAWIEGQAVQVADLEKSLIDGLDHPEHCGGIAEVAKSLETALTERDTNLEQLTEYAQRMRNRAIFKRLGYLAEHLSLPVGDSLEAWHGALSAGYARLDPSQPATGPHNRRWRVQVNVAERELVDWRDA